MQSSWRRRWSGLAAATLVAAALVPAGALSAEAGSAYRVSLADLDLGSQEGVTTLYGRLATASAAVCSLPEARGYTARHRARRCIAITLAAELAELSPGLRAALRGVPGSPSGTQLAERSFVAR